jgi:hypothetical protein
MRKTAYVDAKIGFDTAKNEPSKVGGFLIGVEGVMSAMERANSKHEAAQAQPSPG